MQTFFIRDLETARVAFRSPRPAIVERLRQPMTVAELAASLGEPASRLYYHVNELERVGLWRSNRMPRPRRTTAGCTVSWARG